MKKYIWEIVFGSIACMLFAGIAIYVFAFNATPFDELVYDNVIALKSDFFTRFFKLITFFGGKIFTILLAVASIGLFINRNKSTYKRFLKKDKINNIFNMFLPAILFIFSILLVTILFFVFKAIFARVRPIEWFMIQEDGWSFPSGHTATALAMYGALCLIVNKSIDKKWLKAIITSATVILVALIGLSRIYLGVHYATDVLAGASLGVVVLCITSILLKKSDTKICYSQQIQSIQESEIVIEKEEE